MLKAELKVKRMDGRKGQGDVKGVVKGLQRDEKSDMATSACEQATAYVCVCVCECAV